MDTIIILVSVLLNCAAQLLMRQGMLQIGKVNLVSIFTHFYALLANFWLWLAMLCYAASILLWLVVLSKVQVSYAYPFLSIGYILAALAGYFFFREPLTFYKISGILVICLGVFLISRS